MNKFISNEELFKNFKNYLEYYYFYKSDMDSTYKRVLNEIAYFRLKFVSSCHINKEGYTVDDILEYIFADIIVPEAVYVISFNTSLLYRKNYLNALDKYMRQTQYVLNNNKEDIDNILDSGRTVVLTVKDMNVLQISRVPDYLQVSLFKQWRYTIQYLYFSFTILSDRDEIYKILDIVGNRILTGDEYVPTSITEALCMLACLSVILKSKT